MTDRGLSLHQTKPGETLLMEPDDLLGHLQNVLEKIHNELKQQSLDRKSILQLIEEPDYVSKQLQRSCGHTDPVECFTLDLELFHRIELWL